MTGISSHRPALDLKGSRVRDVIRSWTDKGFPQLFGNTWFWTLFAKGKIIIYQKQLLLSSSVSLGWKLCRHILLLIRSVRIKKSWDYKYVGIGYLLPLLSRVPKANIFWLMLRNHKWRNHKRDYILSIGISTGRRFRKRRVITLTTSLSGTSVAHE